MSDPEHTGPSSRIEATFGFIDLVGFTALTEACGDADAADVATRFAQLARDSLGPADRLIKTIGDAVLVTFPDPGAAIDCVEALLRRAAADPSLPSLRAGLHHGPAVAKERDVFGAAVNVAARVAAEAYAGEVLCTELVAAAAREVAIPVVELGPTPLKNVRVSVPLYSLAILVGVNDAPLDPVCHALVDRRTAAGRLRHGGREHWFCSLACAAAFASNPTWHTIMPSERPRPL